MREEGTGPSAAWSAGANRFSWMRKRVLRKTSFFWLPWVPHRLLLLPHKHVVMRREEEFESVVFAYRWMNELNDDLAMVEYRENSGWPKMGDFFFCFLARFLFYPCLCCSNNFQVFVLLLPSMKPKCPFNFMWLHSPTCFVSTVRVIQNINVL